MINSVLIIITIVFTVLAQLILKVGAGTFYFPKALSYAELLKMAACNLSNVYVIGSILFTLFGGLAWILVVQNMPLSRAYPIMSLNYVVIFLLSWCLFGEHLSSYALFGMGLIIIGTCFLGFK